MPQKRQLTNRYLLMACLALLLLGSMIAYHNSFAGTFIFDDHTAITDNGKIRSLAWPWQFLQNERRPFLYLTFALNYAVGQLDPFGYHVVNLGIHLLAGMLLFGIIYKTLTRYLARLFSSREAMGLSLSVGLLWLLHPVQTASVTYLVQRAESLSGMFYFLTVFSAIHFFHDQKKRWLITAGMSCLLGGLTKEVIFTAPLVILLYDRAFVAKSFRESWRRHQTLYVVLSMTMLVMMTLLLSTQPEAVPTAGFGFKGISPWQYLLNQSKSICQYLKLSIWPQPLIFDYEWPVLGVAKLWPFVMFFLVMLSSAIIVYSKNSILGFAALSFFILLLPSSSFIPLKDLVFEHRLYLPMSSVVIYFVFGGWWLLRQIVKSNSVRTFLGVACVFVVAAGFGWLTYQRNKDYRSEFIMWQDTVQKMPENSRAYNNLGKEFLEMEKVDEAIPYLKRSAQLNPTYPDCYVNLCTAFSKKARFDDALAYCRKALDIAPDYAVAHNNLGATLSSLGRFEESIEHFEKALALGFREPGVYLNLGIAQAQTGQPYRAIKSLEQSLRLDPQSQDARVYIQQIKEKLAQEKPR